MKKLNLYLAFLVFTAFFAFLIACGEGEPIDLSDRTLKDFQDIEKARENLAGGPGSVIDRCNKGEITECDSGDIINPPGEFSSSSESSSSSAIPAGCSGTLTCDIIATEVILGQRISPEPIVKCNGTAITSGISWMPANLIFEGNENIGYNKIVIANVQNGNDVKIINCNPGITVVPPPANAYPVPNFTCSWTPETVLAGNSAKITFAGLSTQNETDCIKKAWIPLSDENIVEAYRDTAYINVGTDVTTSGKLQGKHKIDGKWWGAEMDWPAPVSVPVQFKVKGTLTCSSTGYAEWHKIENCSPLTLNPPPKAVTNPVSPRTITFGSLNVINNGIYFIGTIPSFNHNIVGITNNNEAWCNEIKLEIKGPGVNKVATHTLSIEQASVNIPSSVTADNGFSAVNTDTDVTARVIATCRGKPDTLAKATAKVVPNPALTGDCKWTPNPASISESTQPGGVTILNEYTRCHGVTYDKPSGVSAYPFTVTKEFAAANPDGVIISARADCGTYGNPAKECQKLIFDNSNVDPGDNVGNCEYRWEWCNNWPIEIVKMNFTRQNGITIRNACVFTDNITRLASGTYKINNVSIASNGNANNFSPSLPAKADGGYYIWVPNIAIDQPDKFVTGAGNNVIRGTPECTPGVATNAVAICKSHCADKADGATVGPVQLSTVQIPKVYQLRVYGNENCANLRSIGTGTNGSNRCTFKLNGNTVTAHNNENIGNVAQGTSATIEYLGTGTGSGTGTGCPAEISFKCN